MEKKLSSSFVFKYKINVYIYIYNCLYNYVLKNKQLPQYINIHPEHLAQLREFFNLDIDISLDTFKSIPLYVSERYYKPFCT